MCMHNCWCSSRCLCRHNRCMILRNNCWRYRWRHHNPHGGRTHHAHWRHRWKTMAHVHHVLLSWITMVQLLLNCSKLRLLHLNQPQHISITWTRRSQSHATALCQCHAPLLEGQRASDVCLADAFNKYVNKCKAECQTTAFLVQHPQLLPHHGRRPASCLRSSCTSQSADQEEHGDPGGTIEDA